MLFRRAAFFTLWRFANTVTAQFDYIAYGKDIPRLNVLVNKTVGMQLVQRSHQTGCELRNIRDGQLALIENFRQVRINLLKDRIDNGAIIEPDLTVVLEIEKVRMVQRLNASPACKDFLLVEVTFDESDDGWLAIWIGCRKERAAPLGQQKPLQGIGTIDGDPFVVSP